MNAHHDHDHPHPHDHEHDHAHDHGGPTAAGAGLLGAVFGAVPSRRTVALLASAAALAYACSGIRIVGPAERGIVRRFGRVVNDNVRSGFHFGLPVGIETLTRVRMRKAHRVGVVLGAAPVQ